MPDTCKGRPISGKVATVGAIPSAKQGGSPCADRYHLLAIALRPAPRAVRALALAPLNVSPSGI